MKNQKAIEFFYKNAGYSWDPKTQTEDQGRQETAESLANAELEALNANCAFQWNIDHTSDSQEFAPEKKKYNLWYCFMYDENNTDVVISLCGIDFGPDGCPWNSNYHRVVEAELALEWLTNRE